MIFSFLGVMYGLFYYCRFDMDKIRVLGYFRDFECIMEILFFVFEDI